MSAIKTIIIFDQFGIDDIKFFVVAGDYRHLNNVYINTRLVDRPELDEEAFAELEKDHEKKSKELYELLYAEDGSFLPSVEQLKFFPSEYVVGENGIWNPVIVAGFAP